MKTAFSAATLVAASIPVLVPVAGAEVLAFAGQGTMEPQGGSVAAMATLALAMLGVRLIKT